MNRALALKVAGVLVETWWWACGVPESSTIVSYHITNSGKDAAPRVPNGHVGGHGAMRAVGSTWVDGGRGNQ